MIKPEFLKVKDEPGLIRDTKSNAILASNLDLKKKFLADQQREANIRKVGDINNRVESIENKIQNMETMMQSILEILKEKH